MIASCIICHLHFNLSVITNISKFVFLVSVPLRSIFLMHVIENTKLANPWHAFLYWSSDPADLKLRVPTKRIFSYFSTKTYVVVLTRTVSMRRFFWAPKTYVKTDASELIDHFSLNHFDNTLHFFSISKQEQWRLVVMNNRWKLQCRVIDIKAYRTLRISYVNCMHQVDFLLLSCW